MSNEIMLRSAADVAMEINIIKQQTKVIVLQSSIEIGKRLKEAKELVDHGEWKKWLEANVECSERTAQNMMKLAEEYGNGEISKELADMPYSKAIALLAAPEEEREELAKATEDMSTRELQDLMKELEAERKKGEKQATSIEDLKKRIEENRAVVAEAKKFKKTASEKEAEARKEKERAEKLAKELEAEKKKEPITVEVVPEDTKKELERLRKLEKKAPNEAVVKFRTLYEEWQIKLNALVSTLGDIEKADKKSAEKYRGAMVKACAAIENQLSGDTKNEQIPANKGNDA